MASRLKWVKAMVREVVQHGSNFYKRSDCGGLKGSSQSIRLLKYSHGEGEFLSNSTRQQRRLGAQDDSTGKHWQNGSTLKEAITTLISFVHEGIPIHSSSYVEVLQGCFKQKDLESVTQVHDCVKRNGLEQNLYVASSLLKCYIGCGKLQDAEELFNKLANKDTVCWTTMIGGYAEHYRSENAIEVYKQMLNEGGQPNAITYMSVLKACISPKNLKWGKDIHAHIIQDGFQADTRVATALVNMYGKCGSVEDARAVFDSLEKRDIICWNAMIGALAQHGFGHEAFSLFLQMEREGFTPDWITYLSILDPCSRTGALEWVKEVHAHATKAGLDVDVRVGNALAHMYAKIGSIADAREVFDKILDPDVVSWTTMIGALAKHGQGRVGLQLFKYMKVKGIPHNGRLFLAVLSACSHAGLVDEGRCQIVSMMRDYDVKRGLEHYNCMVDTLGRAGHLEEAKLLMLNMLMKPDIVTWTALLGASRTYNNSKLGELAAKECLKLGASDSFPYALLSNLYSAAGNWDQVSLIRNTMRERGICKSPGQSWLEVDNKVHHFVSGDTTHPEAKEIYGTLNSLFHKLKSEGYTPDTRAVLRNLHEDNKESALGSHSEKLAIAYGLMHVTPEKPIRIYKNLRMCADCHTVSKLISSITGREIVARDSERFHHFSQGSCSCGDYW